MSNDKEFVKEWNFTNADMFKLNSLMKALSEVENGK